MYLTRLIRVCDWILQVASISRWIRRTCPIPECVRTTPLIRPLRPRRFQVETAVPVRTVIAVIVARLLYGSGLPPRDGRERIKLEAGKFGGELGGEGGGIEGAFVGR